MDDNRQQISSILSTTSLVAILVIGSFVLFERPFQSERPPSNLSTSLLESRLWEDPFKAIFALQDKQEEASADESTPADGDEEALFPDAGVVPDAPEESKYGTAVKTPTAFYEEDMGQGTSKPIIIGVLLPTSRFALASEIRRRIRYAVVSALNQTHVPTNSESISVLELPSQNMLVSFESFSAVKSGSGRFPFADRKIIVLWVPETQDAGESILTTYSGILQELHQDPFSIPESVLLGPTSSNGLVNLFAESQFLDGRAILEAESLNTAPQLARLDASLRDPVDLLIGRVDSYLDFGLPAEKLPALVGCYTPDQNIDNLTNANVALCLQGLDIADSDTEWPATIASSYPSADALPTGLDAIADPDLRESVQSLIESAHDYLDEGLDSESRSALIECLMRNPDVSYLVRENVTACLLGLDIVDSDPTWHEYIANQWPNTSQAQALLVINPGLRSSVQQLAAAAHDYLDDGLPPDAFQSLINCYELGKGTTAVTRENANLCLQGLNLSDSDPVWYGTVARGWPSETLAQALTPIPDLGLRALVRTLIEAADSYLDDGMPSEAYSSVVACFTPDKQISSLFSEDVAPCLMSLGITDSNSTWYDTIARNWPSRDEQQTFTLPEEQIVVISPRASIAPGALAQATFSSTERLAEETQIIRSITTDDELLKSIVTELTSVRNLDPAKSRVALIYESDSEYGRALENTFICHEPDQKQCFDRENVQSFSYLRGIDGLLQGDGSGANNDESAGSDNLNIETMLRLSRNLEAPFGEHQFDYLRRLSDEIGRQEYDVIGVLGTDIFDKLLVLQALHERNPEAVFFTTDLDSYIGQGNQNAWSQNLLIASAFSLENPRPGSAADGGDLPGNSCAQFYQEDEDGAYLSVPPFRDSYQTAYFYSTCLALRLGLDDWTRAELKAMATTQLADQVYLYEIGRNGPQSLDGDDYAIDTRLERSASGKALQVISWGMLMLPTIFIMVASWLRRYSLKADAVVLSKRTPRPDAEIEGNNLLQLAVRLCLILSASALVLMWYLLATEATTPGGEPLFATQGISHWPATLIRIQILLLALCFHLYAFAMWKGNSAKLKRLIGYNEDDNPVWSKFSSISAWINAIDADNRDEQRSAKTLDELWHCHRKLAQWTRARLLQVLVKSALLTLAVMGTYEWLTPQPALVRESYPLANFLFGNWFAIPAAFFVLAMVIVANDVTRLNRAFIRALRKYHVTCDACDLASFAHGNRAYEDADVNRSVLVLEVIALRTKSIEICLLFPFVVLLLTIMSRSTLFEGWQWSMAPILLYSALTSYLLFCVVQLQREASLAKRQVLEYFAQLPRTYATMEKPLRDRMDADLQAATRHVTGLNRGAFSAWYRHPLLLAFALPTSGTSGLFLLQQFF